MKQVKCESCGSGNLVKVDGIYVCQNCGMKYSLEEAKRLIEGTVKIDNSEKIERSFLNARNAKSQKDWFQAEKYYSAVLDEDPSNIEVLFYTSYCKAMSTLVDSDLYKRQAAFNSLINVIPIIKKMFIEQNLFEERELINEISRDISSLYFTEYVYNQRKNGYGIVTWTDKYETLTLFNELSFEFCSNMEEIILSYSGSNMKLLEYYYEKTIYVYDIIFHHGSLIDDSLCVKKLTEIHEKWHSLNAQHEIPNIKSIVKDKVEKTKKKLYIIAGVLFGIALVPWILLLIIS